MDNNEYQGLYSAYLQMYNEAAGKGKLGDKSSDTVNSARAAQGSGRLGTFTPARGIGSKKRHMNNTKGDDNRIKTYKDQIKKDKASDRGISDEDRKARARANKEKKAKSGIDDLLKSIRGK